MHHLLGKFLLLLSLVPKLFNENIPAILPESSFSMIKNIPANCLSLHPKTDVNNTGNKPKNNCLLLKSLF